MPKGPFLPSQFILTQFSGAAEKAEFGNTLLHFLEAGSHTPERCPSRRHSMNTLKAEALVREFHYNGIRIPDPGPDLTVEQVRDLLTPNYPEIATASVSGPESTGTVLRYTFSRAIGTKG
jgi:PRTRC genetic system protein C